MVGILRTRCKKCRMVRLLILYGLIIGIAATISISQYLSQ